MFDFRTRKPFILFYFVPEEKRTQVIITLYVVYSSFIFGMENQVCILQTISERIMCYSITRK